MIKGAAWRMNSGTGCEHTILQLIRKNPLSDTFEPLLEFDPELVLVDAMKRAHRASLKVASFAVVVDRINENAKRFYKKYGFLDLSEAEYQLFLPMSSVAEL